ncbi:MAG TPA: FecR family protein [Candidatus Rifleibacterium sp.]|nr:FecR family protein [Candidatus Rifleibacterium sp.]
MTSQQKSAMCQECLEVISGNEAELLRDPSLQQHLAACPECAAMLSTIAHLRHQGSAFSGESYPELKIRIMQRLEPVLQQRRNAAAEPARPPVVATNWFFRLASVFCITVIGIALIYQNFNPGTPGPAAPPQTVISTAPTSFMIALNSSTPTQVSLDNPISLFNGDSAVINVPDGSTLHVTGPARLNVCPRGFHLLQGQIKAEVVAGKGEFVATTPHGQITVLGTVFTVTTDQRRTLVEVTSGRVRVSGDNHTETVLNAGEKTEMYQPGISSETEIIPAVDSE